MMEVTIKADNEDTGERERIEKGPFDMVIVTGIRTRDGKGQYTVEALREGGRGMEVQALTNGLARTAASVLTEAAGADPEGQAAVLAAYMQCFTECAVRTAGTEVMDRAAELIQSGGEDKP